MSDFYNKDNKLPVACPNCGHKTDETIRWLEQNPKITCAGCGSIIQVNFDDMSAKLKEAEKIISDLRKSMNKTIKPR